jgi:hypothetical protein
MPTTAPMNMSVPAIAPATRGIVPATDTAAVVAAATGSPTNDCLS